MSDFAGDQALEALAADERFMVFHPDVVRDNVPLSGGQPLTFSMAPEDQQPDIDGVVGLFLPEMPTGRTLRPKIDLTRWAHAIDGVLTSEVIVAPVAEHELNHYDYDWFRRWKNAASDNVISAIRGFEPTDNYSHTRSYRPSFEPPEVVYVTKVATVSRDSSVSFRNDLASTQADVVIPELNEKKDEGDLVHRRKFLAYPHYLVAFEHGRSGNTRANALINSPYDLPGIVDDYEAYAERMRELGVGSDV